MLAATPLPRAGTDHPKGTKAVTRFDDDADDDATRDISSRNHDTDQDLRELIATAADAGVPIEEMIGGQTQATKENFSVPLLLTFEDDGRRVSYRRSEGVVQLFSDSVPSEAMWVEADARMTLKKALRLHCADLLAFERLHRVTTLDITGMTIRKRTEITIRLLVRRPARNN